MVSSASESTTTLLGKEWTLMSTLITQSNLKFWQPPENLKTYFFEKADILQKGEELVRRLWNSLTGYNIVSR